MHKQGVNRTDCPQLRVSIHGRPASSLSFISSIASQASVISARRRRFSNQAISLGGDNINLRGWGRRKREREKEKRHLEHVKQENVKTQTKQLSKWWCVIMKAMSKPRGKLIKLISGLINYSEYPISFYSRATAVPGSKTLD